MYYICYRQISLVKRPRTNQELTEIESGIALTIFLIRRVANANVRQCPNSHLAFEPLSVLGIYLRELVVWREMLFAAPSIQKLFDIGSHPYFCLFFR
jgi:hypothetical protein